MRASCYSRTKQGCAVRPGYFVFEFLNLFLQDEQLAQQSFAAALFFPRRRKIKLLMLLIVTSCRWWSCVVWGQPKLRSKSVSLLLPSTNNYAKGKRQKTLALLIVGIFSTTKERGGCHPVWGGRDLQALRSATKKLA